MHFVPVLPCFRPVAVNIAVPPSSSLRLTVPVVQLFAALVVVDANAE